MRFKKTIFIMLIFLCLVEFINVFALQVVSEGKTQQTSPQTDITKGLIATFNEEVSIGKLKGKAFQTENRYDFLLIMQKIKGTNSQVTYSGSTKNSKDVQKTYDSIIQDYKTNPLAEFSSNEKQILSSSGILRDSSVYLKAIEQIQTCSDKDECKKYDQIINEIPSEQMFEVYSGLSPENLEYINQKITQAECSNGWFTGLCKFMNKKTVLDKIEANTLDAIRGLTQPDPDKTNSAIKDYVKKNIEDTLKSLNINDPSYDDLKTLKLQIDNAKANCQDDACIQKADMALSVVNPAIKNERVKVKNAYSIIDLITNPDSAGVNAAKLFGFEANYDNLPIFLRESVASQICYDKIEGYLDKNIENDGGVTTYGCTDDKLCIEVISDLRAYRTAITPDNKTYLTYSYYIKGREDTYFEYSISVYYEENSNIKKVELESGNMTGEGSRNNFDTVELDLNTGSENISQYSFKIVLDGNSYIKQEYPVVLIAENGTYDINTNKYAGDNDYSLLYKDKIYSNKQGNDWAKLLYGNYD